MVYMECPTLSRSQAAGPLGCHEFMGFAWPGRQRDLTAIQSILARLRCGTRLVRDIRPLPRGGKRKWEPPKLEDRVIFCLSAAAYSKSKHANIVPFIIIFALDERCRDLSPPPDPSYTLSDGLTHDLAHIEDLVSKSALAKYFTPAHPSKSGETIKGPKVAEGGILCGYQERSISGRAIDITSLARLWTCGFPRTVVRQVQL
jgi:hypothetical protein